MWDYQHSVETTGGPASDLAVLVRRGGVAAWNDGIERIEIDGRRQLITGISRLLFLGRRQCGVPDGRRPSRGRVS